MQVLDGEGDRGVCKFWLFNLRERRAAFRNHRQCLRAKNQKRTVCAVRNAHYARLFAISDSKTPRITAPESPIMAGVFNLFDAESPHSGTHLELTLRTTL
jgi:hypothetical protein